MLIAMDHIGLLVIYLFSFFLLFMSHSNLFEPKNVLSDVMGRVIRSRQYLDYLDIFFIFFHGYFIFLWNTFHIVLQKQSHWKQLVNYSYGFFYPESLLLP